MADLTFKSVRDQTTFHGGRQLNLRQYSRWAWLVALMALAGLAGWLMHPRYNVPEPPPRFGYTSQSER